MEASELVRRKRNANDNDDEAGTIDADRFVQWVEYKLVPTLGNYHLGEARSIVVMDNATIHMDARILQLISGVGALLIYQAAYSPDMDPIEFAFHQYKAYLKRNLQQQGHDPQAMHLRAMSCVTAHNMCNYYSRVGGIRNVPQIETLNVAPVGGAHGLLSVNILGAAAAVLINNVANIVL